MEEEVEKIISTFGKSITILDKESIDFTAALQWSHPGAKKHSKTLPLSANGKDSLNSDLTWIGPVASIWFSDVNSFKSKINLS